MNQGAKTDGHTQNQPLAECNGMHCSGECGCHILFHPDYNRRPRNHTGSADLFHKKKRSRAFWLARFTAGGDFHPALRTSLEDILQIKANVNRFHLKAYPLAAYTIMR